MDYAYHAKATSAGLDGWRPAEFKWIGLECSQLLAAFFNCIEEGGEWPRCTPQGQGTFLAKSAPASTSSALEYRVLVVLPAAYRLWARARQAQVGHWERTWQHPVLLAGIGHRGAQDGWYTTSIEVEESQANGLPTACASLDLWKCFDRIVRQVLYAGLVVSGFPLCLLWAYSSFQEALTVRFALHGAVGKRHRRQRAIPQGCPWSMKLMAFASVVWARVVQHRVAGVIPRLLADDMMVRASGPDAGPAVAAAANLTDRWAAAWGATLKPDKSVLLASTPA